MADNNKSLEIIFKKYIRLKHGLYCEMKKNRRKDGAVITVFVFVVVVLHSLKEGD